MPAITVLALSGSLRSASLNTLLIQAAAELAPAEVSVETYRDLGGLPPYDADVDTPIPPQTVATLRARIAAADGLLIATPEYNQSLPGVLKNALDWASTPPKDSVLAGKPTAIMGASPSPFGTARAQGHLRQVLTACGAAVVAKPEVMVFGAHESFDAQGRLIDQAARGLLAGLCETLHAEVCKARIDGRCLPVT